MFVRAESGLPSIDPEVKETVDGRVGKGRKMGRGEVKNPTDMAQGPPSVRTRLISVYAVRACVPRV